jgi:thiamine biosynthesis lipoprotein
VTARGLCRSETLMGTVVSIQIVEPAAGGGFDAAEAAIAQAFDWFRRVEAVCTRFNPDSELRRLAAQIGRPVEVSPILFEAVQFALAVADETDGAFDPTLGIAMETRGFNREYSTGHVQDSLLEHPTRPRTSNQMESQRRTFRSGEPGYRHVTADPARRTITIDQPLVLDLGGVAKGLAVDTAAKALQPFGDFAIDAGGDLYLGGRNAEHELWSVGIRHPRLYDQMIETVRVSDKAVCTSGDYERAGTDGARHLLDPRGGGDSTLSASATVIAPTAILADALATAAFVLGPNAGIELLERVGVEGLIFSPAMDRRATRGLAHA